jgi:hypothetical protein
MGFTKKISTANGWNNLGALLRTAGYDGGGIVSSIAIMNHGGAAVTAYLHLTNNGNSTSGLTAADGWPITQGADDPTKAFYSDRGANMASLDIGTTWINTVGVVELKIIITGS